MRSGVREALRQQYGFCCGYCGISETDNGAPLTVDHFQPRTQGGTDRFSSLVYCCRACNENKGDWWQPDQQERVLHPLNDEMGTHVQEQEDGTLLALTAVGEFHLRWLKLNRPFLFVTVRKRGDGRRSGNSETNFCACCKVLTRGWVAWKI